MVIKFFSGMLWLLTSLLITMKGLRRRQLNPYTAYPTYLNNWASFFKAYTQINE